MGLTRLTLIPELLKDKVFQSTRCFSPPQKNLKSSRYLIITSFPSATRANADVLAHPLICLTQPLTFNVFPLCSVYVM